MSNSNIVMGQAAAGNAIPAGTWDLSNLKYDDPGAWDVSTAETTANQDYFDVGSQEATPNGLFFKPDGTKMYVVGTSGDDVNEYNLGTAWDVTTAVYSQNFSLGLTTPSGLFFKADGTVMYVSDDNGGTVNQYTLSTAWDVSTASYSQNVSVNSQGTFTKDVHFKADGTKMYTVTTTTRSVHEWDLSTAWDISTASYFQSFVVIGETSPQGLFFKPDGTILYTVGASSDFVDQYALSTPWDISTASLEKDFRTDDSVPTGIFFRPDGGSLYVVGQGSDRVYQYWLGGIVNPDSYTISFKPDGSKLYLTNIGDYLVEEYTLPKAWDISSARLDATYNFSATILVIKAMSFKPDGTKMYLLDSTSVEVKEFSLSTAWDITTASFTTSYSVSSRENQPTGLAFSSDGAFMIITGTTNDRLVVFSLTTPWDVSTAVYYSIVTFPVVVINPEGIFFKPDGLTLYVFNRLEINQYSLSTPWTGALTLVYTEPLQSQDLEEIFIRPNGTKAYFLFNLRPDRIYTYSLVNDQ